MLNHWISHAQQALGISQRRGAADRPALPEMRRVVTTYHCGWVLPETLTASAIADLVASLTDEAIAQAKQGCRSFIEADNWTVRYEKRLLDLYTRLGGRSCVIAQIAERP